MQKRDLFSEFPLIQTSELTLRKIDKSDLDDLFLIYSNENLFKYRPSEAKKSKTTVENMISHFERDFKKKKTIFLGICLNENVNKVVGVAEIFDYDVKVSMVTIGYTLNETYWGKGIAAKTVDALRDYLINVAEVNRIQAYVMPDNIKSKNVLQRNRFTREGIIRQGTIWTGKGIVDLEVYSLLKSDL